MNIRKLASEIQIYIKDEISYLVIYKNGSSWEYEQLLDLEYNDYINGNFTVDKDYRKVFEKDENCIVVNGYYDNFGYNTINDIIFRIKQNYDYAKQQIINLTPHDVNIVDENLNILKTFESKGVARVSTKSILVGSVKGVDRYKTEYGEVTGLPDEQEGIYYIVSMLVKQALPNRTDLFSPSQLQRNSEGQPIGCLGLE